MSKRNKRRTMSEINVVPYVDVMLVLLIIFMATTPLMTEGVDVELPQADARPIDADEVEQAEPLIVSINANGEYFLNQSDQPDQPVSGEFIKRRAAATLAFEPKTKVLVRGDSAASHGMVVKVMVLLQQAGATSVDIVTQAPELNEVALLESR